MSAGPVMVRARARPTGVNVGEHERLAVTCVDPVEVDAEDLIAPGGRAIRKDGRQRADHELDQCHAHIPVGIDRRGPLGTHQHAGLHVEVEGRHVPFVPDVVRGEQTLQRAANVASCTRIVDRTGGGGTRSVERHAQISPAISICTATRWRFVRSTPSWSSSTLASYRPSGSSAIRVRMAASVRSMIRSMASMTVPAP